MYTNTSGLNWSEFRLGLPEWRRLGSRADFCAEKHSATVGRGRRHRNITRTQLPQLAACSFIWSSVSLVCFWKGRWSACAQHLLNSRSIFCLLDLVMCVQVAYIHPSNEDNSGRISRIRIRYKGHQLPSSTNLPFIIASHWVIKYAILGYYITIWVKVIPPTSCIATRVLLVNLWEMLDWIPIYWAFDCLLC